MLKVFTKMIRIVRYLNINFLYKGMVDFTVKYATNFNKRTRHYIVPICFTCKAAKFGNVGGGILDKKNVPIVAVFLKRSAL